MESVEMTTHLFLILVICMFFLFFPSMAYNFFFFFFLSALGLCCCAQAFSSGSEWGLLFVAVHGLLIVVASLVAEHGL